MLRYVLPHLVALLGLVVLLYLPGLIVDHLTSHDVLPDFRHLTRFVVGIASWCTCLFWTAAFGALRPAVLWTVILATLAGLSISAWRRREVRRSPDRSRTNSDRARPAALIPRWEAIVPSLATAIVIAALFVLAMRPMLEWDADTYHLTVPRLWIEHGGFRRVAYNVYSNWPMDVELLFGLAMLFCNDHVLATLIHPVFAVLTVVVIISVSKRHGARWAGPAAACAFLANDVVLFEGGAAYINIALAFFLLMAIVYLVEAERDSRERTQYLLLTGLCCGVLAGTKLLGLFGIAGVVANLAWDAIHRRRVLATLRATSLFLGLPTLLLAGPWYVKSYLYTGNPVYPMAFGLFGGIEWNGQLAAQFSDFMARIGNSHSVADYLLLPARVFLHGGARYEEFGGVLSSFWIVLLPIVVLASFRDETVRRFTLPALIYFLCWAGSSQQARFLIPILPLLAVATALAVERSVLVNRDLPFSRALSWGTSVVAGVYLVISAQSYLREAGHWMREYRDRPRAMVHAGVLPVYDMINQQLPANARLMFLNTNHGFFCHRDYIADSFFEASQINTLLFRSARTTDDIAGVFRSEHISHVLVWHWSWKIPYPTSLGDFLRDPTRSHLVYQSPTGDLLYEVNTTDRNACCDNEAKR